MDPRDFVGLTPLMGLSRGNPDIRVGIIDGPALLGHPEFAGAILHEVPGAPAACGTAESAACGHGTFVTGILAASRESETPGICPGCTLLIRPVFTEQGGGRDPLSARPAELAAAIVDTVDAGASVLNLSVALLRAAPPQERELHQALDYAASRQVVVIAAAGNQGMVGRTAMGRHSRVIPVAACDERGAPLGFSNLGGSTARRGLIAPGDRIAGLAATGGVVRLTGTSVAAPFVTGAVALLWSLAPGARADQVTSALVHAGGARRTSVTPPRLDAWAAHQHLQARLGIRTGGAA